MKKRLAVLLLMTLLVMGLAPGALALWNPDDAGIALSSEAVWLENLDTGTVVWQKNADEVRSPASLTKMMTCLLLLESGADLDTEVTVPTRLQEELDLIQVENGADVKLVVGETITLRNLLYSALLPSANDAASVIGDWLSGGDLTAFVAQMNRRAAELGCTDTSFNCAHGLYEDIGTGNWSTARDMARIAKACVEQPLFVEVSSTAESWLPLSNKHTEPWPYTDGTEVPAGMWLRLGNTNLMLDPAWICRRDYIRGLKTGYTTLAGRCFATTAVWNGETYLLVEMGCPNVRSETGGLILYDETATLLDWVKQTFTVGEAVGARQTLAEVSLLDCPDSDTVTLCTAQSVTALLDNGTVEYRCDLPECVQAPIEAGQTVGTAEILVNGEPTATVALVSTETYRYSALLHLKNRLVALFAGLWGRA